MAGAGEYEYVETVTLSPDGAATVEIESSATALALLRGIAVDTERPDPNVVRGFYAGEPMVTTAAVDTFTRDERPFFRVRAETADLTRLSRVRGLAWSLYRIERDGSRLFYRQVVGFPPPPARELDWEGDERVAFRVVVPGEVESHTSPNGRTRGGDTVVWEQPLSVRLRGGVIDLQIEIASR